MCTNVATIRVEGERYARFVLVITHDGCLEHNAGARHPERPDRLRAALEGVASVDPELLAAVISPRSAQRDELELVHGREMIDRVEAMADAGGGHLDADTPMNGRSLEAALLAAGSVMTAVELVSTGSDRSAYCVVRPPGHHATPHTSMGFCLFNSVAVAAAALAAQGERVAIVDIDAHHGNGTQDIFYDRSDVLYASIHQWPLYPGTGAVDERGSGDGTGFTVNVPVPPGATGDVALAALDEVIVPAIDRFDPGWVFISAGYDGHRADPLTELGYSSSDYGDMVRRLLTVAPSSVVLLEGGYDLDGIRDSSSAVVGALIDAEVRPEPAATGGPGMDVVHAIAELHDHDS